MSDKDEAIQRFEASRTPLRNRLANLSDDAFKEPGVGDWNVNQLLAHMAGWLREMAPAFDRVARGERANPPDADYSDVDSWNARSTEGALPHAEAVSDFDAASDEFLAAARRLGQEHYGIDAERARPRIGNRLLEGPGTLHFMEHGEQVKNWLASRT